MVAGRFKAYIGAVDKYILSCESRTKWLKDIDLLFRIGVILLFLFNTIDVIETYYSVVIDGRFLEENELVVSFVGSFFMFLGVKIFVITIALGFLMLIKRYSGMYVALLMIWFLDGMSFLIIAKNLVLFLIVALI